MFRGPSFGNCAVKICVVGPGALGLLLAARFAAVGHQVWILDHDAERAASLEAQGLILHDAQGQRRLSVRATSDVARIGLAPLVLLCVKSPAVETATRQILPCLDEGSLLIALQNGIAHHALLAKLLPQWALGVTAQGAHLLGPGEVKHGGSGSTSLGFLANIEGGAVERLRQAVDRFNEAGISTQLSADILTVAWNKLIVNAGINAISALEGCANGELLSRPDALATLKAAVSEAAQVARACRIPIVADPVALTVAVCRDTAANYSSMVQDVRRQRRTEIEAINGMIVRQAEASGVTVPVNRALVAGVKAIEAHYGG